MSLFKVMWRIENFSMCPHQSGEMLCSPEFTIPEISNKKWKIQLYPRGKLRDGDYLSCFLQMLTEEDQNPKITLTTSFIVIKSNSYPYVKKSHDSLLMEKDCCKGYLIFMPHEILYEEADLFLPNDVFTLQVHFCHRSRCPAAAHDMNKLNPSYTPNTVISTQECFSKENEYKDMLQTHCAFTTRIPVERRVLTWSIDKFEAKVKSKQKMSVMLGSEFHDGVKLVLVCYVEDSEEGNQTLKIDILRKGPNLRQTFIKCEVSFLDTAGVELSSTTSEHVFGETYSRWTVLLIDKLGSSKHLTPNDSLKLMCEFRISYRPQNVESLMKSDPCRGESNFLDKIQKMLKYEETSDARFVCKNGEKFPVHQFMLSAQSPVFRAIFSSDSLEKQTGMIRMQDIDVDTVRHLRDYLYSYSLPDLQVEDMLKLYWVADKYDIQNLKTDCASFVKSNINVDNVHSIITVAKLHGDDSLKDYAEDFLTAENKLRDLNFKDF